MATEQPCKRCSKPTAGDDTISLWDGESYCKACVDAASPTLVEYAKQSDALQETAPYDSRAQWRNALRLEAVMFLIFGAAFMPMGYLHDGLAGLAIGAGVTTLLCSIQGAMQLPMFVAMGRRRLPTVMVRDGEVKCFRGGKQTFLCRTVSLRDIKWRIGKSRQDSGLRNTFIQRQQVVLLILPCIQTKLGRLFSLGKEQYACGWSSETIQLWTAFLTLAEIPQER